MTSHNAYIFCYTDDIWWHNDPTIMTWIRANDYIMMRLQWQSQNDERETMYWCHNDDAVCHRAVIPHEPAPCNLHNSMFVDTINDNVWLYNDDVWCHNDATVCHRAVMPHEPAPYNLHNSMFVDTIKRMGSDEQVARWLPLAESYRLVGTYAQTELGHGQFRDVNF